MDYLVRPPEPSPGSRRPNSDDYERWSVACTGPGCHCGDLARANAAREEAERAAASGHGAKRPVEGVREMAVSLRVQGDQVNRVLRGVEGCDRSHLSTQDKAKLIRQKVLSPPEEPKTPQHPCLWHRAPTLHQWASDVLLWEPHGVGEPFICFVLKSELFRRPDGSIRIPEQVFEEFHALFPGLHPQVVVAQGGNEPWK